MALVLGELVCTYLSANQGVGLCNYTQAPIIYGLAIPKGSVITAANFADIKTYLRSLRINNDPFVRVYLTPRINGVDAGLEDANIVSAPDRSKFQTIGESWTLALAMWNASMCAQQNLKRAFNFSQDRFDWLFIDANYKLLGQKVANATTGATEMGGFATQYARVLAQTLGMFDATPNSTLELSFPDVSAIQDAWFVADISNINFLADVVPYQVQNVEIVNLASPGTNTFTFSALTGCGGQVMGKDGYLYTQMLQAGVYDVVVNGTPVVPSAVAINQTTGVITLTATAVSGATVVVGFKAISVLAALTTPLKYYEVPVLNRKTVLAA